MEVEINYSYMFLTFHSKPVDSNVDNQTDLRIQNSRQVNYGTSIVEQLLTDYISLVGIKIVSHKAK